MVPQLKDSRASLAACLVDRSPGLPGPPWLEVLSLHLPPKRPPGLLLLGLPQAGEAGRGGGRGEMEIGVVTDGVRLRDMEVGMRGGDDGCVARTGKDSGGCMADVCGVG